jgi:hypothetical protein
VETKTSGLICGQMVDFFLLRWGGGGAGRPFFEKLLYEVLEAGDDFWRSHLPEINGMV